MHRGLQIADIVRLIAKDLSWDPTARVSLRSFVLTCATICETALDELWRHGVQLAHLLRVLPDHVLAERSGRLVRTIHPWIVSLTKQTRRHVDGHCDSFQGCVGAVRSIRSPH